MKTILLQLRDAAKECRDPDYAYDLRRTADEIQNATNALHANPTSDNMIWLNGIWVRAWWLLDNLPKDDLPGGKGLRTEARLAACK